MKKLVLAMLACITPCCACLADDSRLIRRLYLDSLGMPPTPEEIDWYMTYNKNRSYSVAVEWVTANSDNKLKEYYMSEDYKNKKNIEITQDVLDSIIKYQVGSTCLSVKAAETQLIKNGTAMYTDPLEAIDYFCMCMMSRVTHVDEANLLMRVFKAFKSEEEGYREVIGLIKEFRDFRYK